ncbi:MFS transporter [Agrococcus terreus]|uniref:MFS transporter n=1 Tax=Agrococcus terreus TaxID=574649 RepID=UPI00384E7C5C
MSAASPVPVSARLRRRSMLASAVGNGLEWFDWNIYVVFTAYLTANLFDQGDPGSALLLTLAIFGVGFVFRPVGGMLAGILADRLGRRWVMIATMLTMSAASLLIALIPDYATAGVWASVLLLVARLAQGLAHGAESTAGYTYIAEIAPAPRRGLWSSTLAMGVLVGSMLASGMGWALTTALGPEAMGAWGWRIPFAVGALLAIVVMVLRRTMMETEQFEQELRPEAAPVRDEPLAPGERRALWWASVRVFWFVAAITIVFYTWLTAASSLATTQHGMDPAAALASSFAAQALCVCLMPLMGRLSDRVGRRPVALAFSLGFVVLSFPLMGMISSEPWTLLVAQSIALAFVACGNSIYSALLAEQFPTRHRARGIGIAMSLSVAIFGGSVLYLNQWLTGQGLQWLFVLCFVLVCLASAVAVWRMPETKGVELRRIGERDEAGEPAGARG